MQGCLSRTFNTSDDIMGSIKFSSDTIDLLILEIWSLVDATHELCDVSSMVM